MAEKKLGMGTVEINKKFKDREEAYKYAKRLKQFIYDTCKKKADKGWLAQAIIVTSELRKDVSRLRYHNTGKRGRPPKENYIYERTANEWYKGDYKTDWHLHIIVVSKPSYAFRNAIKIYIDKNWTKVPDSYEKKSFDMEKEEVYKKTCNIKMADYFIDQSNKILFCNHNYGNEEKLKYSLKEYYRESLKMESAKRRFYAKLVRNYIPEEKQLKALQKIEGRFKEIEKYFYDITEEKDKKESQDFMKTVQLSRIKENYYNKNINKVQNISRRKKEENSVF